MPRRIPLLSSLLCLAFGCGSGTSAAPLVLWDRVVLDGASGGEAVAWSRDGDRVGLAWGQTAGVWDLATGARQGSVALPPPASVDRVVFTPDLGRVYAFGRDAVTAWDTSTGAELFQVQPPADGPRALAAAALSPDGATLATASFERPSATTVVFHLILWDASTGARTRELVTGEGAGTLSALAWSPDGALIAGLGAGVTVWDARTGTTVSSHPEAAAGEAGLAWSPGGGLIASTHADNSIALWDPRTGETRQALRWDWGAATAKRLAWSPDDAWLVAAIPLGTIERVAVWDTRTGKSPTGFLPDTGMSATAPNFGRDGSLLAITYPTGINAPKKQVIWETRAGRAAWEATGQRPLAFHPSRDLVLREAGGEVVVSEVQRPAR